MSVCIYCCVFFLVHLLTESSSGAGVIFKSVCIEHDVQIFENISLDGGTSEISLYTNGVNRNLIGIWPMKSSEPTILQKGYEGKVLRDEKGTIWIRRANLSDEEKYVIQYESSGSPTKSEVQIEVMVPPTKDCKPKVRRMNTSLGASLEASACGKPAVSVHWLDFHGNSFRNKTVNLPPKKEAGTYYACIDGPALQCVNTSRDYCSNYTIGENSRDVSVCQGNRVQLFESSNIDVDVYLYKYGANLTFIASWYRKTSIKTSNVESGYEEKVLRVKNGDIWMQNVDLSDEGKYIIYYETDGFSAESEVQIEVLVSPSRHCKPKIEHINNILQVSVEAKDCGKSSHVSLRDNHGNFYRSPKIRLPPGKEDVTYNACIEGPALECVNGSADYCSDYVIQGSNSPQSSGISHVMTPVYVMLAIVILLVIIIPMRRTCWRKFVSIQARSSAALQNASNAEPTELEEAVATDPLLAQSTAEPTELEEAVATDPLLAQSTGKEEQPCTSRGDVERKDDCSSQTDKESGSDKQQISPVGRSSEDRQEVKTELTSHFR